MIELLLQAERALEMGRIDAAEMLYRQVAEADPRNSIAVVGLARVTLERGDELGAYLAARRALTIDPENAAASRMVQRLEEVMRYRGDPVPVAPDVDGPVVPAGPVDPARDPDPVVPATAETALPAEPARIPDPVVVPATAETALPAERARDPDPVLAAEPAARSRSRSLLGRILDRIIGRR